ncbi:MAG TPA: hypothetical protein VLG27_01675 [Candidatus Saccharimonadia bacterium]|nr:hypothetical protein [Candidatus Saccharimonadia bacterium]
MSEVGKFLRDKRRFLLAPALASATLMLTGCLGIGGSSSNQSTKRAPVAAKPFNPAEVNDPPVTPPPLPQPRNAQDRLDYKNASEADFNAIGVKDLGSALDKAEAYLGKIKNPAIKAVGEFAVQREFQDGVVFKAFLGETSPLEAYVTIPDLKRQLEADVAVQFADLSVFNAVQGDTIAAQGYADDITDPALSKRIKGIIGKSQNDPVLTHSFNQFAKWANNRSAARMNQAYEDSLTLDARARPLDFPLLDHRPLQ